MSIPSHFVFVLMPNFSHLAFSCAIEPLRLANLVSGQVLYRWTVASEGGKSATASNGCEVVVHAGLEPTDRADRLFIVAGKDVKANTSPQVLAHLRRERAAGTPLAGVCTGAFVLAKGGFLDGMDAAVHWAYHDLFREEFPEVRLVGSVFVAHERIMTASGGTAVADLMLCLIRKQHGDDLTTQVADQMVYNAVREESAAQRVSFQSRHGMRNAHLVRAIAIMEKHIENPLSLCEIAEELGISARQLERLFNRYLDSTPKSYFVEMRINRNRCSQATALSGAGA
ncbi:MAG TPA: DJ-1/PfpI family protein [Rhodocyclaceae bacterium]|nr:DJ-1/PfpI family protein [Rhodocyclaceae bacterium]